MLAGPSAALTPDSPESTINRSGCTPDIGIVMRHPASCTIHFFCCLLPGNRHLFYHLQKWFMQFRKICFFCRPIIHFRIDVDGVLAIPWRTQFIVPDSLQVGRLTTGLRRRNQQVTAILIIKRDKLRIIG